MSCLRALRVTSSLTKLRLCSTKCLQPAKIHNIRQFSLKESVETFVKTQTGIFKAISESTPVEYFQKLLITVHDTTGLPWWGTIICTTIFLRSSITVPLALYQNYILAKYENIKIEMPEIAKELKQEVAMAVRLYNWNEKTARRQYQYSIKKQYRILIVRDNCHPMKSMLLLWFQIPTWICYSVALRNLVYMLPYQDVDAHIRFLEFTAGGFAWIPNLTMADSSLILPVMYGITNLAIIELQSLSKVTVPTRFQRWITNFFRGFSIILVPIAATVPSCLALYWTTSSVFGLVQNLVLLSPKVKRKFNIPKTPSELENPYTHVWAGIKHRLNSIPGIKVS